MGITGLIPFLDKATEKSHVSRLPRGSRVAVDAYCWLHKGAFACADQLARGEKTDLHIKYCMKFVNMLLGHSIQPILVFDGRHLPAKAGTEKKRRENRETAKRRAAELMRLGKHEEARQQLRRCVDITHRMALELIQQCHQLHVDCIVAPYEADGQLAFLNRSGLADYVVTEDSDLTLFGCKRILFKLDLTGACLELDASKLPLAMGCKPERYTFQKFRFMCIMSGCDYLDSLPGIGLAKSCKFVLMTEEDDLRRALTKIPAYLNMRHLTVSDEYQKSFLRANATFQHMIVYDPRRRSLVRLSDPDPVGLDEEFCDNAGEFFDDDLAFQMALGNVDPFSFKQLDRWSPDSEEQPKKPRKHRSIWSRDAIEVKAEPTAEDVKNRRVPIRNREPTVELQPTKVEGISEPEDVLAMYAVRSMLNNKSPSSRKPFVFDPLEKMPNLCRNPFGVTQPKVPVDSPTKITPENRSLLQQCSPVKRIVSPQFQAMAAKSPTRKNAQGEKLRGGIRGMRTLADRKQNVLSRFFQANQKAVAAASAAPAIKTDVDVKPSLLEMQTAFDNEQRAASLFYEQKTPVKSPDAKRLHSTSNETPPAKKSCRALLYKSAEPILPKTTDTDSDVECLDPPVEQRKSPPTKSLSQKPRTATVRPSGLRRTKSTTLPNSNMQSKLSAFGFKKKSIAD